MKKNILKAVALVLLLCTAVSLFAACKDDPKPKAAAEYTYRSYSSALSTNWNPHTWEENSASTIHSFTEPGFVDLSALDTKNGIYQWVYEMATSVKDVTADNKGDLTKYGVTLPGGQTADNTTKGYVFEIKLNPNAKWENGTVINADTYIYSMQQLLNSKMRNYRANLYVSGESALAGALAYYNSEARIYASMVKADGYETVDDKFANGLYFTFMSNVPFFGNKNSLKDYYEAGYGAYFIVPIFDSNGNTTPQAYTKTDKMQTVYVVAADGLYARDKDDGRYLLISDIEAQGKLNLDDYVCEEDEAGNKTLVRYNTAEAPLYEKDDNGTYYYDEVNGEYVLISEVPADADMSVYAVKTQDIYKKYEDAHDGYQFVEIKKADATRIKYELNALAANFGDTNKDGSYRDEAWLEFCSYFTGKLGDKVEYDKVGLYKVDDYTLHYVCQTAIDINYFMTSCTSTWLVYEDLYERNKDTSGTLVTTRYGSSADTYMSYGPYRIASYEAGKQMVFVQNENWYGWTKNEDGSLTSTTKFKVDGEYRPQYQTTKIVIDVLTDAAAKQLFLKGELSEWSPTTDDLVNYANSERLYQVDETYTMSFFFDTNVVDLQKLDRKASNNKNSVVLSNINFRKAMSLAINRAEWVKTTSGYKPAYAIMNNLYFYDVYNDPNSSYRSSDEAMQAICNLYGVEYGEGKIYKTLEEAYKSISGYNVTEAKALMKTACDELVAAGLYTAGEDIHIRIAWAKGAVETADQAQCKSIENFLNAALEGSGFGKLTLEPVGNLNNRYSEVSVKGNFAIGFGAWGGAAFYPFRNFQVYCDSDQYDLNEAKCWDPATEKLTITLPDGREFTMTWKEWSGALIGTGALANEDFDVKLFVTATLEEEFLKKYYRIPLAGTAACSLMSYQVSYYTETYNIMYDFGGFRLMKYNYTDAEWADYVKSQNGTLKYE